jgi:hypothetical protein
LATRDKANLSMSGRLADNPDPTIVKGGKLKVEFLLFFNGDSRFPSPKLEFVTFDQELGEYILENFSKGEGMKVTKAAPMGRHNIPPGQPNYKWCVFDVALKDKKGSLKDGNSDG